MAGLVIFYSTLVLCIQIPLGWEIETFPGSLEAMFLPARASEQGNVIGLVSVYIYSCHQKKIVIERTRDLIYLKFVATDFSPKIFSPSTGENSGDSA